MKILKLLYIWIALMVLLNLYGELFPSKTAPGPVAAPDSLARGNGVTGPAGAFRGP